MMQSSKARRLPVALALVSTLVLSGIGVVSTSTSAQAVVNPGVLPAVRQAAAESIVMVKNDNQVLPLTPDRKVSVFGRVQVDTFYGGYGSGSLPNADHKTSIINGLKGNAGITLNQDLVSKYQAWTKVNPVAGNEYVYAEMPLADADVQQAASVSDTAVVVVGRAAGEGGDTSEANYRLTAAEKTLLSQVTSNFDRVVVVLNIGNVMDMSWVEDYPNIDSVLILWQAGMETGPALADILSGDQSPSGKLTDTVAYSFQDYPARGNFGGSAYVNYAEDIFVGYRYFETFAKDRVQYPFGFGLSYTTFDIDSTVLEDDINMTVQATVTNTGTVSGKEVVQVYYGAPQGKLGKASKSLAAYAKTNTLAPGASETVTLTYPTSEMSSYDDSGVTEGDGGAKSAWVLEGGDYPIYVGDSVRSSVERGHYHQEQTKVVEQLSEALAVFPASSAFERWHATAGEDGEPVLLKSGQTTPTRSIDLKQEILDGMNSHAPDLPYDQGAPESGTIKLADVYSGAATMDQFIAQMNLTDLAALTSGGDGMGIGGRTSVYGGVTPNLRDVYGVATPSTADGPAGMRISARTSQVPSGAALAATWNDKLVEQVFAQIGKEMLQNNVDTLLAPGLNIHRDPLCGRNFEYFSEDPLIAGRMGSAVVEGVQSQGVAATPKHFAANNQETNRWNVDSRISERALREIYLKGFEIVVKQAKPQTLMTSYNRINSVTSHDSYELNTRILRDQWGYKGITMTDWGANIDQASPDFPGLTGNAYRLRAGHDILKPGDQRNQGSAAAAVQSGVLNVGEVQVAAKRVLEWTMNSQLFRKSNELPLWEYEQGIPWFVVDQPVAQDPVAQMIFVDGKELPDFTPEMLGYTVFLLADAAIPEVTATPGENYEATVVQGTPELRRATVTVTATDGAQKVYRVSFSDQAGLPIPPGGIQPDLAGIKVNGQPVPGFGPNRTQYTVWVPDLAAAEVVGISSAGVKATVSRQGDAVAIRAESKDGARLYTVNLVTSQTAQGLPQSDEFDGTALKSFWSVTNGNSNLTTPEGVVRIKAEAGDWYAAGNAQHNVVWQNASGDWSSVTKFDVDAAINAHYQQAGVMIFDDKDNFLQMVIEYNDNTLRWGLKNETGGSVKTTYSTTAVPTMPGGVLMRVDKTGNQYSFYVWGYAASANPQYGWTQIGSTVAKSLAQPKFGLLALTGSTGNGSTPQFNATYDWVRFSLSNRGPQDLPASDEFDGQTLGSQWSVVNQTSQYSKPDGSVQIKTETGEWFQKNTTQKNAVSMDAPGDWKMTTKMSWDKLPAANWQQLGLTLYDDPDNFIQYFLEFNGSYQLAVKSEVAGHNPGGAPPVVTSRLLPADPGPGSALLRVEKNGFKYRFSASFDEGRSWVYVPVSADGWQFRAMQTPKIGLTVLAPGSNPPITVNYDFVRFEPLSSPVRMIQQDGTTVVKAYEESSYFTAPLAPEATSTDPGSAGSHLGYTAPGLWSQYDLSVEKAGWYQVTPRIAMNRVDPEVQIALSFDGKEPLQYSFNGGTGGWQSFTDMEPQKVYLTQGSHQMVMKLVTDGLNVSRFAFEPVDGPPVGPVVVDPVKPERVGNTVTIPEVAGVVYRDESGNVLTGDVSVPSNNLVVLAKAVEGYKLNPQLRASWLFAYDLNARPMVDPVKPERVGNTVTIPEITGVVFKDGLGNVLSGQVLVPKANLTVFAIPDAGYRLNPQLRASWLFAYDMAARTMVDPLKPVRDGRVVTIPVVTGVVYRDGAGNVLAGDVAVPSNNLVVLASPADGYRLNPELRASWLFPY